jgi:hypothetical protein
LAVDDIYSIIAFCNVIIIASKDDIIAFTPFYLINSLTSINPVIAIFSIDRIISIATS